MDYAMVSRSTWGRVSPIFLASCLGVLTLLGGCKAVECGEYYPYAMSPGHRTELMSWVDTQVLSRSYDASDLRLGRLSGPGRHAISLEKTGIVMPAGLNGAEIRILGADFERPAAVFIGKERYQGLIVTRDSMPAALKNIKLTPELLDSMSGRLAIMCYQEKENLASKPN